MDASSRTDGTMKSLTTLLSTIVGCAGAVFFLVSTLVVVFFPLWALYLVVEHIMIKFNLF
jgi:hypothetical protein